MVPFELLWKSCVWGTKDAILGTMRNDNEASFVRVEQVIVMVEARDNENYQPRQIIAWGHHACLHNLLQLRVHSKVS